MIYFGREDSQMLDHTVSTMRDKMLCEDGYTLGDHAVVAKVEEVSQAPAALVLTGGELNRAEERELFRRIVNAELDNWVPNASQRLIFRAGRALGVGGSWPRQASEDCGDNPGDHSLFSNWVAGIFVRHCATCHRLFRD